MKLILITISLSAVLLGFGCTQKEKQTDLHQHEQSEAHAEPDFAPVQLDNGEKWIANQETTDGVNNLLRLLDNPTSNIQSLKESMTAEVSDIFKKCTMKGESHEQLHNFLLPLKEKIEKLQGGNVQDLEEIKSYLNTYKNYFE